MAVTLTRHPSDIDPVALGALFAAVGFRRNLDPVTLRGMLEGSRFVVGALEQDDRLVGFARGISDGVSNGYVSTVAVLPSHQRQGIGRRLMVALLDEAPAGIKWVVHTSEAGERLYRSLGFDDATRMLVRDRRG